MDKLLQLLSHKKIILWDFDGCFCHSEPFHYRAYAKAFEPYGHSVDEQEYYYAFTHKGGGVEDEMVRNNIECNPEAVRVDKSQFYKQEIASGKIKIFPEIASILRVAHSLGVESAIASNSSAEDIKHILSQQEEKLELKGIFGYQPNLGMRKKPFPDIFLHALKELNFVPEQALVIEDSERGLRAALAAGCDALWIKTFINENFTSDAPFSIRCTHQELLIALRGMALKS